MSEYLHVEKPFLQQLATLGWKVTDQGQGFIPSDPTKSLRTSFREWFLPEVFREALRSINLTPDDEIWLTDRQLDDLRDQILRQPNHTLLEANETTQGLFLKAQVDHNGALDNVFVERLWRSVKYEEVYIKDYASVKDAIAGLSRYFDFYNHKRPHQSLDYQTPFEVYSNW
jgi:hypothetical protein